MTSFTLLVCGGRGYGCMPETYPRHEAIELRAKAKDEWAAGWEALDALHAKRPVSQVIQGEAPGGDALGKAWAIAKGIPVRGFHADWKADPRAAGMIRNKQMLVEGRPKAVFALPGGKGTADMVKQAKRIGLPIYYLEGAA